MPILPLFQHGLAAMNTLVKYLPLMSHNLKKTISTNVNYLNINALLAYCSLVVWEF